MSLLMGISEALHSSGRAIRMRHMILKGVQDKLHQCVSFSTSSGLWLRSVEMTEENMKKTFKN